MAGRLWKFLGRQTHHFAARMLLFLLQVADDGADIVVELRRHLLADASHFPDNRVGHTGHPKIREVWSLKGFEALSQN